MQGGPPDSLRFFTDIITISAIVFVEIAVHGLATDPPYVEDESYFGLMTNIV